MTQQAVSFATQGMELPPRYEYLLELEQSGGARCHLAIDPGNGPDTGVASGDRGPSTRRLVSVHLVPRAVAEDDELRSQFAARAAAFLALRHPNLVSTFEAVSEGRRCHWVSEFVPGEPLSRLLKKTKRGRRALSTRQILAILCDVVRALEHAHGAVDAAGLPRPVVHRNLRPTSVLVTYEGMVKVSGELCHGAPEVRAVAGSSLEVSSLAGSEGPFDGLPARLAYLAPECCSGDAGDVRCDVYSVGAILWEALAGRPRSAGLSPQQALALRLGGGEPALEDVCPDVLPALAAVTRRALSTDPGDRHQSMSALREELEQIAQLRVLVNETSPLFGFMCNHFFEEYTALQALLEEHSMLHLLFGSRAMSQTGSRALPPTRERALSQTGAHPISQTGARARSQTPFAGPAGLAGPAGPSSLVAAAPETGRYLSVRESGLRRVPEANMAPPTTPPVTPRPALSRLILDLPLAKLQLPEVGLPLARAFGRTRASVIVLGVAGALIALGVSWAGSGRRTTGAFESAEPATVVSSIGQQLPESGHAEPSAAASAARFPSPLGSVMSIERASAASSARTPGDVSSIATIEPTSAGSTPAAHRVPERGIWKRLRSERGNSSARATRRNSPIELAGGRATSAFVTRDGATWSDLDGESTDGTGVDLRMLKERPPRAIDKQNPYSP